MVLQRKRHEDANNTWSSGEHDDVNDDDGKTLCGRTTSDSLSGLMDTMQHDSRDKALNDDEGWEISECWHSENRNVGTRHFGISGISYPKCLNVGTRNAGLLTRNTRKRCCGSRPWFQEKVCEKEQVGRARFARRFVPGTDQDACLVFRCERVSPTLEQQQLATIMHGTQRYALRAHEGNQHRQPNKVLCNGRIAVTVRNLKRMHLVFFIVLSPTDPELEACLENIIVAGLFRRRQLRAMTREIGDQICT